MNSLNKFFHKNQASVTRFFEFILGFSTWVLLTAPIWLGLLYPPAVVYLLAFFTIYWFYLSTKHSTGLYFAYKRHTKEIKIDWQKKCEELDFSNLPDKKTLMGSLKDVRHFILIPVVNEPLSVITSSIKALANQTFDSKQIVLVYTIEEKYSKEMIEKL